VTTDEDLQMLVIAAITSEPARVFTRDDMIRIAKMAYLAGMRAVKSLPKAA
jgi:hypothetical protein